MSLSLHILTRLLLMSSTLSVHCYRWGRLHTSENLALFLQDWRGRQEEEHPYPGGRIGLVREHGRGEWSARFSALDLRLSSRWGLQLRTLDERR